MDKYQWNYLANRLDQLERSMTALENMHTLETHFTIQEVAASLKVTPTTIQRKINSGDIQAVRIGREYRISKQQLEFFLENRTASE